MVKITEALGARVHIRVAPGLCGERDLAAWDEVATGWHHPVPAGGTESWADGYEDVAPSRIGGAEDERAPLAA